MLCRETITMQRDGCHGVGAPKPEIGRSRSLRFDDGVRAKRPVAAYLQASNGRGCFEFLVRRVIQAMGVVHDIGWPCFVGMPERSRVGVSDLPLTGTWGRSLELPVVRLRIILPSGFH
jgi:hypothetical protein